ncbi:hypothetical protein BAUCODRAFT_220265 [Baudoinia panamericana UAMH 10762]|uniref:Uncharacterized protein n=1 Tax=Baudoinia panamericana (strain UAMH 10762) TaxID=717646 RepID=M2MC58_BAUPA|nr:uncharacterized protein BAUCODRAFT_220265 [Baudoinia panamericana UAMH 10762]EMC94081.1 hypothetical protein BAUCODRAFT_220265 [Baudoinia panamericana UAMH 10762]
MRAPSPDTIRARLMALSRHRRPTPELLAELCASRLLKIIPCEIMRTGHTVFVVSLRWRRYGLSACSSACRTPSARNRGPCAVIESGELYIV